MWWKFGKLWKSDESDKSMDLVNSTQSEDLSKDLLGNLRIPPKTWGFHELDE